jgi:hypothetical protein
MPEMSPERKSNPEPLTSGDSNFESAKRSPALELTGQGESSSPQTTGLEKSSHLLIEDLAEGRPHYKTECWTKLVEEAPHYLLTKSIEGEPQFETDSDPLAESSYWTEPRPNQPPYSPIKNLFANILNFDQSLPINTITMAQPVAGPKELNLNKPEVFDGNQDGFKEFLQNVEVYMDVNHKTYNNDLGKIAFVLLFMATGAAAT